MFRGFFGFKSINEQSKRDRIYSTEFLEEQSKKRKYEQEKVELKERFKINKTLDDKKVVGLKVVFDSRKSIDVGLEKTIKILEEYDLNSSLFFASGAEGKGESLLSLLNPLFYREITKSKSLKAEGFKTLFSGLLLPPKNIGIIPDDLKNEILKKNYDIGSYCFSPSKWVKAVNSRNEDLISLLYHQSIDNFEETFKGKKCTSFSAPYFICSNATMLLKESLYFDYSSDCRGIDPFLPVIDTRVLKTPQVPVTLPMISEFFSINGEKPDQFFDFILDEISKQRYPVYEINPLFEINLYERDFRKFLENGSKKGIAFTSLRDVMAIRVGSEKPIPRCTLSYGLIEGRRRAVTIQMLEV